MIVVLMGAAGAGKTTVGTALARALGWTFIEADTLHPAANIEKIRAGIPLDEADRAPWLARTRDVIAELSRNHVNAVVACSALREQYRATLAEGSADIRWVFLDADAALLADRLRNRRGHFAGPEILESQLETLEPPRNALRLPAELPVKTLVESISTQLGLAPSTPPAPEG